uniref:Uncharacterized protein n=1 Tax=Nothobranchius furzeri TaxID=105023 RepID=A0A8C6P538_NOTFU
MKLELVLMLAVAALAPSLSDSRIVSVCELKDKLGQAIPHRNKEKNRDDSEEKEKEEDSSQEQEDSSDDDDDDDSEEGTYGIFQLSDGHACESGYRPSRNQCRTDCSGEFMHEQQRSLRRTIQH